MDLASIGCGLKGISLGASIMKRFNNLTSDQKAKAIRRFFDNQFDRVIKQNKGPQPIKDRIQKIKEVFKFCGCVSCIDQFLVEAKKDCQISEYLLAQATVDAEQAFYIEKDDLVSRLD